MIGERHATRVPRAALAATMAIVASVVISARPTSAAAAIVECVDARGVSVLTSNTGGSGCAPGSSTSSPRRASPPSAVATATPVSFPRVTETMQRSRDSDRARILRDELATEAGRLAALEAAGPSGGLPGGASSGAAPTAAVVEQLARTRENIRALQRELAGVR